MTHYKPVFRWKATSAQKPLWRTPPSLISKKCYISGTVCANVTKFDMQIASIKYYLPTCVCDFRGSVKNKMADAAILNFMKALKITNSSAIFHGIRSESRSHGPLQAGVLNGKDICSKNQSGGRRHL
jgi:hypothetical protein